MEQKVGRRRYNGESVERHYRDAMNLRRAQANACVPTDQTLAKYYIILRGDILYRKLQRHIA